MGVLRTIAIIILVIYALRVLARLFAPLMIRYVAKKAEKKFSDQFRRHAESQERSKEGETVIDKAPKTKPSKDVGDYIDFEEVD
ncbi:hypothetical protein IMCC3317_09530 [Kordia antarctica]|uniref:DUF4834 domain-containing protein n=1 Tax=Kordia antarctica TaxID=1218801 RepID=A0A7L4ZGN4_9FLAO|nr:DUF4834 family protein [Kordia antarctica]QHI35607.1 hypothetical protein IMCC3317_09530 [Kordia antarctica]